MRDHVYPGGTRDTFAANLSIHSVSCGSVVPCVETSRVRDRSLFITGGHKQVAVEFRKIIILIPKKE